MHFRNYIVFAILAMVFLLTFCKTKVAKTPTNEVKELYTLKVTLLKSQVDSLLNNFNQKTDQQIQQQFLKCRYTYKFVEPFVEYYNPTTAKGINGPALLEVEPDNPGYPVEPTGFQVVEESLFPVVNREDTSKLMRDLKALQGAVQRAIMVSNELIYTDKAIFDALRLQLFRIQILGLSGFDSPIALNSVIETEASITGISAYLNLYPNEYLKKWNVKAAQLIQHLKKSKDFYQLNQAYLLTKFFNPLGKELFQIQTTLQIPFFDEQRPLRVDAQHLFQKGIFNAGFYSPNQKQKTNEEIVNLGKMLFFETKLSSNGTRSCSSCHNPQKGFTDGLKKNTSFDGQSIILRNTPTILYAGLQPAQFADSRIAFLEDQIKQVAENPLEMHGNLKKSVQFIKATNLYSQKFEKAYPNQPINELKIQESIAAYIRSKSVFNSRFDEYMKGDETKMNQQEVNGFNLFMGKGKCGTCHFMPLFNGNVPPVYMKIDSEVLGVPADKSNKVLDKDLGKYTLYKALPHKNSFKTPTIRNASLTAPYMHNGVYDNLNEVMAFYNKGGGVGLNLNVPNQTLPADPLNLNPKEVNAIIAFLKTLNDQ